MPTHHFRISNRTLLALIAIGAFVFLWLAILPAHFAHADGGGKDKADVTDKYSDQIGEDSKQSTFETSSSLKINADLTIEKKAISANDSLLDDSDYDGLSDAAERFYGTDPNDPDSDDDGLWDGQELSRGTNPHDDDTDNDGFSDFEEVWEYGSDPTDANDYPVDSDGDGLYNRQEAQHGSDPNNPDTDDDGISDGDEVQSQRHDPPGNPRHDPTRPDSGPYRLEADYVSASEVELSWWNSLFGGDEIHVERSTNQMNWTRAATLSVSTRSYTDTVPNNCRRYYYRVRAFRFSDGKYSNHVGTAYSRGNVTWESCPHPNANTRYRLYLEHLYCHDTTELGNDEPYIVIVPNVGNNVTHTLSSIGSGEGMYLGPIQFDFNDPVGTGAVLVHLYESDSTSGDDHIGLIYIRGQILWDQGMQGHRYTWGADYNLSYRVERISL